MAHEDQATATGPAFEGEGSPRAAFSTGRLGTDSTYGVNVIQDTERGVYGESVNTLPRSESKRITQKGIGVCGIGDEYGVFGKGRNRACVHGETQDFTAIGVAGITKDEHTPLDPKAVGVGIVGPTESGQGFGVVGLSFRPLALNKPTEMLRTERDPKTGPMTLHRIYHSAVVLEC
jgi:hypothetical protein